MNTDPLYYFFLLLNVAPFVLGAWLLWRLVCLVDAWFSAKEQTIASNAGMIAPDDRGLLPVARQALESGALVQEALGLVNPALVRPDDRGLLPVSQSLIHSNVIAEQVLALLAAHVANGRPMQPVPHTISYAPHMTYRNDVETIGGQLLEAQGAGAVPTFRELLDRGELGNGRFLLGYSEGIAILGDWRQLYSTALGGMSGTGKSTTARFLLGQAALNGCKFAVIDPHAGAGDESLAASLAPLGYAMLCEPAANDKQIVDLARCVRDIGRRRIGGDADRAPIVVAIDETTALLSRSTCGADLGAMIEEIAQEYRKVNIFALCSAQIWLASRAGGSSALRDSFASTYIHRMKRKQANLLAPAGAGAEIETLHPGQALLWQTSGESKIVTIPLTTSADIAAIAQRNGATGVAPLHRPLHLPLHPALPADDLGGESEGENGTEGRAPVSGKEAQALRMFRDGAAPNEIIKALWGANGGKAYQKAAAEFNDVLRRHMGAL